jgi:hypothetical protein
MGDRSGLTIGLRRCQRCKPDLDDLVCFWALSEQLVCASLSDGIVKAKSNTLPARLIQISPPLIFLDFSGPIQAVPRPSQVFRILL